MPRPGKLRMPELDRLWAPWRSAYHLKAKKGRACIFCAASKPSAKRDREQHVLSRGKYAFAMLNRYPYNNGHFMVAPKRHVGRLEALRPSEWLELLRLSRRIMARINTRLHPDGFNAGFNLGKTSGAGFPGHLHLHVVPRWNGDTNFMPVIGQTKVVSQWLDEVHDALRDGAR